MLEHGRFEDDKKGERRREWLMSKLSTPPTKTSITLRTDEDDNTAGAAETEGTAGAPVTAPGITSIPTQPAPVTTQSAPANPVDPSQVPGYWGPLPQSASRTRGGETSRPSQSAPSGGAQQTPAAQSGGSAAAVTPGSCGDAAQSVTHSSLPPSGNSAAVPVSAAAAPQPGRGTAAAPVAPPPASSSGTAAAAVTPGSCGDAAQSVTHSSLPPSGNSAAVPVSAAAAPQPGRGAGAAPVAPTPASSSGTAAAVAPASACPTTAGDGAGNGADDFDEGPKTGSRKRRTAPFVSPQGAEFEDPLEDSEEEPPPPPKRSKRQVAQSPPAAAPPAAERFPAPLNTPGKLAIREVTAEIRKIDGYTHKFEPILTITTLNGTRSTLATGPRKACHIVLENDPRIDKEVTIEVFRLNHPLYHSDALRAHLENHVADALVRASSARCKAILIDGDCPRYFRRDDEPARLVKYIWEQMGKTWTYSPPPDRGLGAKLYFKKG
jgi:hypothetical protein